MADPALVGNMIIVGTICVLCTSIGFNRPSWSRSYTSATRYRRAFLAHIAVYTLLLLLVYEFLRRAVAIYSLNPAKHETLTPSTLAVLVWISLGVTLCARALSSRPRAWLQRMAGIPSYAQRLAALLADSELNPAPKVLDQTRATLLSRGVDIDADWLPIVQPTHRLLFKATALFIQIREWEETRRFAAFITEAKNDIDLLRRRFDRLSFRVSRTLTSIERLGQVRHLFSEQDDGAQKGGRIPKQVDDLIRKIVGDLIADSCEDIGAFHEDACLVAARGALVTRRTRRGCNALYASLGFELKPRPETIGYGFLVTTGLLLYCGMWLFSVILPTNASYLTLMQRVTIVSLIVFGTMAIAIVPKLRWGFANAGLNGKTPILFVVGAGLCAVLFAVIVNLSAGAFLLGGPHGASVRLCEASPWLISAFVTGATMAWLVQDHRWRGTPSPRIRRMRDAATLGSVWLLSSVVSELLLPVPIEPFNLVRSTLGSFAFGVIIGLATPESARRTDMRVTERVPAPPSNLTLFKPRPIDA